MPETRNGTKITYTYLVDQSQVYGKRPGAGRGWRTILGAGLGPSQAPQPSPGSSHPPVTVSQISTQRKVNIYNILQEIIQQEGELEEHGVQRLVAIASKEMRENLEVVEPWAPWVPGPLPLPQGLRR